MLTSCLGQKSRFEQPQNVEGEAQNLFEIIEGYSAIEFYSLEPKRRQANDNKFHGYLILDKRQLTDQKQINTIVKHLYESINQSIGERANCFLPRHV